VRLWSLTKLLGGMCELILTHKSIQIAPSTHRLLAIVPCPWLSPWTAKTLMSRLVAHLCPSDQEAATSCGDDVHTGVQTWGHRQP
jgi:hypothetical protein